MEYKSLLEIKSVDDASGQFTGYLAVFGNLDSDSDIITKGAFKVSLASGRTIPILWQHIQTEPIGLFTSLKEDDHGLLVTGKLAIDTGLGARAYALLKMRAINGLSIGYKAIQQERIKGVRYLREVKLFEGSIVTFEANNEAIVTDVKHATTAAAAAEIKMNTFKEALAAHELRKDLSNQRWMIEDAKDDSMDSILSDESLDKPAKKTAARKTLHDAADAHADLMDQRIDAIPDADPNAVDGGKGDKEALEVKAARASMATAIAAHVEGERKCMKAMDLLHQGAALHTKGIVLARQLTYAGIISNDDKNALAAAGKAAADAEALELAEFAEFTASVTAVRSKIAA